MKKYIVINVGCIECGVSTKLVGVYATRAYAKKVAEKQKDWREGGQSFAKVFEIEVC